jgi:hypothetical protein
MEFFYFRLSVSESLLYEDDSEDDSEDESFSSEPPVKRAALPSEGEWKHKAKHLPRMMELKNTARCRNPTCKTGNSRVMCTSCKVYLCIRGCYEEFHK